MPKKAGIRWLSDSLTPRMAVFVITANFAIAKAMDAMANEIEEWMKDNAPWEDRTGAAREGLTARRVHEGFRQSIYIYHTVDYGIWLEVRWNGKYAIIVPALEHFDSVAKAHFTGLLERTSFSAGGSLPAGLNSAGGGDEGGEE